MKRYTPEALPSLLPLCIFLWFSSLRLPYRDAWLIMWTELCRVFSKSALGRFIYVVGGVYSGVSAMWRGLWVNGLNFFGVVFGSSFFFGFVDFAENTRGAGTCRYEYRPRSRVRIFLRGGDVCASQRMHSGCGGCVVAASLWACVCS